MLTSRIQVGLVQLGASAEQIQFVTGLALLTAIDRYTVESRLRDRILSR